MNASAVPIGCRHACAAVIALAAVLAFPGCGGSASDSPSGSGETTEAASDSSGDVQQGSADMLTAPKAEESVREAEARISDAVASGKCDRIAQLFPLAQQGRASKARCKLFKTRFEKAEVTGSERFGDGGAVIDYAAPGNDFTAILLLERDGLHHVAFLDPFLGGGSVGTPPAAEFGPAAEAGLAALAERNCQAFVDVASRRFGPGALEQSATCDYVRRNPLASLVEAAPDAQLQNLGGNADYAMYGFAGPGAYYVIVTGRESQDDAPASAPPLPEDAPEYAFIGAFRTNVLTGSSG